LPGDPILAMAGEERDPATIEFLREKYRLNDPVPLQYVNWLGGVVTGDFGISLRTNQPVLELIGQKLPVTIQLAVMAMFFAMIIGIPIGILAAVKKNTWIDYTANIVALSGLSIPNFWLGIMLILLVSVKLGWLPVLGYVSISDNLVGGMLYLVLPVMTLVIHEMGVLIRMARASTLEVLRLDYITHARAKGLSESAVLWRHAFKNAFGPTWTMIGLILGNLLGGIAVIETVFTIPGLGRLMVDSIFARDYPVIQGCLLFVSLSYVLVNLFVDLLYPLFDPRVVAE